jgi:hypothetical protein
MRLSTRTEPHETELTLFTSTRISRRTETSRMRRRRLALSLIELAEEFVDNKVDVVTIRFSQLTSVSREKIYYPPSASTI